MRAAAREAVIEGLSVDGRGLYDATVVQPARRLSSTLLLSLACMVGCASGTDDSGNSGLSVGPISQGPASQGPSSDPTAGGSETSGVSDTSTPTDSGPPPATADSNDDDTPVFECGNGMLEANEECDGADLDGQTCESFGYPGGSLTCLPTCSFDFANCTAGAACGDGTLDEGEMCDCGNMGGACSAAQLGNVGCAGLTSPKGGAYNGGTLGCNAMSCSYNTMACTYCGDGVRNGGESCDGADLGGQTCATQGFTGGSLSCSATCTFSTAGCMSIVCGDGMCQAGEDSCTCPSDCISDPMACDPCECGTPMGGNCGCDIACIFFEDCCPNGPC